MVLGTKSAPIVGERKAEVERGMSLAIKQNSILKVWHFQKSAVPFPKAI